MFLYLIDNASNELRAAVCKLKIVNPQYKFDYRNTTIDLLDNNASEGIVREYEALHDNFYLQEAIMKKWNSKLFELEIKGELPSLNEIITASKAHYGKYNKMKSAYGGIIKWQLRQKVKNPKPLQEKVNVKITWTTKNLKKDPDNVAAGIKFILDAFVEYGILENDTRRYIGDIYHTYEVDKEKPRCKVELFKFEEVE